MESEVYIIHMFSLEKPQTGLCISHHILQYETRLFLETSLRPVYYESSHSTHLSISLMADIV